MRGSASLRGAVLAVTTYSVGLLVSFAVAVVGSTVRAESTGRAAAPVVVELFTSQSCSSCPPADALLSELARRPDVLPLAFHVDYWNRLGWFDPFSTPEATARQREYAQRLGLKTVYTPQMIIAGQRDVVGSNRQQVEAALARATEAPPPVSTYLAVRNGALTIDLGEGAGEGQVWLLTFDRRHETRIKAGENAGRTLVNVNIVRHIDPVGMWNGAPATFSYPMPATGSADSGAAVLLQAPSGAILGAASLRLPG